MALKVYRTSARCRGVEVSRDIRAPRPYQAATRLINGALGVGDIFPEHLEGEGCGPIRVEDPDGKVTRFRVRGWKRGRLGHEVDVEKL